MAVLANPAVDLAVELLQGDEAHRCLDDSDFVRRWNELFQRCNWSMPYLSVDYALAWYRCYGDLYQPLLIRSFAADGRLAGLLTLGVSKADGKLVFVGAPHAEYAAWLSDSQSSELFVEAALDALSAKFPAASLTFRFLAPGAPVEWARSGGRWASRCIVFDVDRPEIELQLESIRKSLSKRSNRNRFNRLRRHGQLEFRRVTDVDALATILDSIFLQHDLRQIALFGMQPFRSPARTKRFYLELMRSGRLHVTVSTIDDQIVAAVIGICDRETVRLELLCHSPRFSAQSPGKLHLLTLAQHLVTEGFHYLDLTPGDLLWKDRSATRHNSAHEIIVAFSRPGLLKARARVLAYHRSKQVLKPILSWLRLEPRIVKDAIRQLTDEGLRSLVGQAIRTISGSFRGADKLKVYHFENLHRGASDHDLAIDILPINIDALDDLFLWNENSVRGNRAFLRRAYHRLCAGEHVFTHAEGGRLSGLCWARPIATPGGQDDAVSPCFLLHDVNYHPSADRKHLCRALAQSVARACGLKSPDGPFTLCARQSDRELIAALDELQRQECADRKQAAPGMLTASAISSLDVLELVSSF